MEKRLLFAISLSFFVLFFWGIINPAPKSVSNRPPETSSQYIANKEDTDKGSFSLPSDPTTAPTHTTKIEELTTLSNSKLVVTFSSLGGSIKHVVVKDYDVSLPLTEFNQINTYDNLQYELLELSDSVIKYSAEVDGVQIVKKYTLVPKDYLIENSTNIINVNNNKINIKAFRLDVSSLDKNISKSRDKTLFEYSIATTQSVARKANMYKLTNKEIIDVSGEVNWIGFRDRYFCAIYKPLFKSSSYFTQLHNNTKLDFIVRGEDTATLGNIVSFDSVLFFGPQDLGLLSSYPYDFKDIMKFSNFGILDSISKVVYKFLQFLHKLIPVWGICIILTAIIVYLIMYPLSINGMKSMKKIQALQPEIAKIREQNKNNPQKLQKETMELYKTHQVNPFGGCLPLLLQMPFFIGVYQVLWRSVAFKNSKFLWINDLSQPDRLITFPTPLPLIGEYFNILPILMIIIMVMQQKFSAKNMVVTDPAQESSQKMMMFLFPLMIGFVFYNIASGLALYFTTFYLLSSFTQWKISKIT